jgi:uncharacterized repeat protein (TIGR03803 family)
MQRQRPTAFAVLLALFAVATFVTTTRSAAQTERVLHSFTYVGPKDGAGPYGGVVIDSSGNLYGATNNGGAGQCTYYGTVVGCGTVFEFSTEAGAGRYKILHNFQENGKDGYSPVASVTLDSAGNLYGTTSYGGSGLCSNGFSVTGCGTVFELSPKAGGGWSYKILHSFRATSPDGSYPEGNITVDSAGHLYGTTFGGGAYGYGTVFELAPASGGGWTYKVLHSFNNDGVDGYYSNAQTIGYILYTGSTLALDASGNLYGVTDWGGANNYGSVFKLTRSSGGVWTEAVVYNFDYTDGANPTGALTFDASGNLYGTTVYGNLANSGTVYELTPGSWSLTQLHYFTCCSDGYAPQAGVTFDASGNLYGTTVWGGSQACGPLGCGSVFELTPASGGLWTETLPETFSNIATNGANPVGGLAIDAAGHIFGTTLDGGTGECYNYDGQPVDTCGTVFEIRP